MKKYTLEFVGTFLLVLLVSGALIINEMTGGAVTNAGIALVFGLTLAGLTLVLGKCSGAHINPAVTLAFSIDGTLKWKDTLPYLFSQCAGALAASLLLRFLFPTSATLGAILQTRDDVPSFMEEFNLTLLLVVGILSIPRDSRSHRRLSALVTGGIATLEALLAGPLAGSSMNPARSLAPAILTSNTEGLWIYLLAPLCAAAAAAGLRNIYENLHAKSPDKRTQ